MPGLVRTLQATRLLAARVAGDCPVLGAVVSPFSLPAMQLGLGAGTQQRVQAGR